MNFNIIYSLILLIVIFNLFANILIKRGATSSKNIFINKHTLLGYVFFVMVVVLSIQVITEIQLKYFSTVMATNYFLTYIGGIVFFKERVNLLGVFGIIIVSGGLIIFFL